jgi:hypothetical protein
MGTFSTSLTDKKLDLSNEKLNEMSFKPYSIIKVVGTRELHPDSEFNVLATVEKSYGFTYKTFIKYYILKGIIGASEVHKI